MVEYHGGNIGHYDALANLGVEKLLPNEGFDTIESKKLALFRAISRSKALAIGFIKRSDRTRYVVLINDLENQYSRGLDQCPTDLPKALNTIDCYMRGRTNSRNPRHQPPSIDNQKIEMNFAQIGSPVPGINGVLF